MDCTLVGLLGLFVALEGLEINYFMLVCWALQEAGELFYEHSLGCSRILGARLGH